MQDDKRETKIKIKVEVSEQEYELLKEWRKILANMKKGKWKN